jgi:hypothetical protein
MDGACSTHARDEMGMRFFNLKAWDNLEDLDIDGKIALKWAIREVGWEILDWINLIHQDRDR